jgi:antitoxin (DNA-binding transcriptional repressor) of toxin-antitoxin stability system
VRLAAGQLARMVAEAEAGRPSVLKAKGRAVAVLVPAGTTSPVLAAAVAEVLGQPAPAAETGKADKATDARKRLIREAAERRAAVKKAPSRHTKRTSRSTKDLLPNETEETPVLEQLDDDEPLALTDVFEKGIGHE